jgi:biotin transport system substrate-specific component
VAASVQHPALFAHSVRHSALSAPLTVAVVALAVTLTAVSAQFTLALPFTVVPFTFTPMAVLLVGAALGRRLGAVSMVLYVGAGAAGLPVFAPSAVLPPGALRVLGPTGGFLLAYPLAAFAAGWLAERGWDRRYLTSVLAMLAGLAVIYAGGVAWLSLAFPASVSAAFLEGITGFVAVDVLKLLVAGLVLPSAWRLAGRERSAGA